MKKANIKEENPEVSLPLYMYDHSGISISTSPCSCRWDSGQIGFVLVSKKKALEEFGGVKVSRKKKAKIERINQAEVEPYTQYVEGDVYGFQIVDEDDNHIDSCYGFYGSDHKESGMLDYIDHELLGLSSREELEQLVDTLDVEY